MDCQTQIPFLGVNGTCNEASLSAIAKSYCITEPMITRHVAFTYTFIIQPWLIHAFFTSVYGVLNYGKMNTLFSSVI